MENITEDIKPRGIASAYIAAPFDDAKKALESKGYKIISLEENARLRMQEGKGSFVSRNGNRTREGVIYTPDKSIFLTKNSPIMESPKKATNAHRSGNEYVLTGEQVEQALSNSVKLLGKSIPTNRFKDNEITAFVFGDVAEDYGIWLANEAGIKEMPVYLANVSDKPFARQMWFRDLGGRSVLNGYDRDLDDGGRLRGVKETSEAGSPQKILYSEKQISKALKELGFSGLEKGLIAKLK